MINHHLIKNKFIDSFFKRGKRFAFIHYLRRSLGQEFSENTHKQNKAYPPEIKVIKLDHFEDSSASLTPSLHHHELIEQLLPYFIDSIIGVVS
jgi:hypothetical protein